MTSKEALKEIRNFLYEEMTFKEDVDNLTQPIERDIILVETLKRVLSKVVYAHYLPEFSEEDKDGFIKCTSRHEIKTGEDFDVELFSEIIDQLGFKLVNKEL